MFILIIKAHLSSDSNNSLCPQVQYVSATSPLHTLKVLSTNLAIWHSTSTAEGDRSSSLHSSPSHITLSCSKKHAALGLNDALWWVRRSYFTTMDNTKLNKGKKTLKQKAKKKSLDTEHVFGREGEEKPCHDAGSQLLCKIYGNKLKAIKCQEEEKQGSRPRHCQHN